MKCDFSIQFFFGSSSGAWECSVLKATRGLKYSRHSPKKVGDRLSGWFYCLMRFVGLSRSNRFLDILICRR